MKGLRERLAILRKVNQTYERSKQDHPKNPELNDKIKQLESENKELNKNLKELMQNQAEVSISQVYK